MGDLQCCIDVAFCEVRVRRNHSGPYRSFATRVSQLKISFLVIAQLDAQILFNAFIYL